MKDYLQQIVSQSTDALRARLLTREYLQARVLQRLQDAGAFSNWAFQGGTCLRFLFSLSRFSEDLDFALASPGTDDRFRETMTSVRKAFETETYIAEETIKDTKTVRSAFVGFPGLLHELGLSPHRSELLSIKVELDSRPPEGARMATTIVRRHVILNLFHHDKASLFAGKIHAILTRRYTKGRDLYDLMWYLSDRTWPSPNLTLLNNALKQTRWCGPIITSDNWCSVMLEKVRAIDWHRAVQDVQPFLERKEDAGLLNRRTFEALLGHRD